MASDANKKAQLSPVLKGFAGSLGGVAEACFLQPMDVIKTRIQLDKEGKYRGIIQTGKVGSLAWLSCMVVLPLCGSWDLVCTSITIGILFTLPV